MRRRHWVGKTFSTSLSLDAQLRWFPTRFNGLLFAIPQILKLCQLLMHTWLDFLLLVMTTNTADSDAADIEHKQALRWPRTQSNPKLIPPDANHQIVSHLNGQPIHDEEPKVSVVWQTQDVFNCPQCQVPWHS